MFSPWASWASSQHGGWVLRESIPRKSDAFFDFFFFFFWSMPTACGSSRARDGTGFSSPQSTTVTIPDFLAFFFFFFRDNTRFLTSCATREFWHFLPLALEVTASLLPCPIGFFVFCFWSCLCNADIPRARDGTHTTAVSCATAVTTLDP